MHIAGVEFAVLGSGETCSGDPARRMGNEFVFQQLAMENVETLNAAFEGRVPGTRKIVATCPHCFNSLGREYPQVGGEYEVIHHTQLLSQLVEEGRLTPVTPVDRKVTYHDPCFLGRHNKVYTPPREILDSVQGLSTQEMHRCKDRGFCCGAGGARMWMEEKIGKRINAERTEEALELDPDVISTACPFCITMLSDALNTKKQNGEAKDHVEVLDVSQILLRSMAPVGAQGTDVRSRGRRRRRRPAHGSPRGSDRAARPAATAHADVASPRTHADDCTVTCCCNCGSPCPPDRTDRVRELFENDPGTAHLAVLPGASVSPAGDLVLADVARESADGLVARAARARTCTGTARIAITVDRRGGVPAPRGEAEEQAPGDAADAVVWEQVIRTTDADSALSVSYLAFLTIATLLAAIAIINDSAILTIGAMVLGPEFVPLAALAVAVVQGRPAGARRAASRWSSASSSHRADGAGHARRPLAGLVRPRTARRRPAADRLHHLPRQLVAGRRRASPGSPASCR